MTKGRGLTMAKHSHDGRPKTAHTYQSAAVPEATREKPACAQLSIVIPCYEEHECLPTLLERTQATFGPTGIDYELVLVNDGSRDGTWDLLASYARAGAARRVVAIDFSRNFGKESALLAGITHAHGENVAIMDADLQQPPETLLEMYHKLIAHPEVDCVAAFQRVRHEGRLQAALKEAFYRVFNAVTDPKATMLPDASDFRVFRRPVAEALLGMPEYHRFSKGLFAWVGFETLPFPYEPSERAAGQSKWSLRKLLAYALEGIFAFSTLPLRLATWVGSACSVAAVIYFFVVLAETAHGKTPDGYPTIVCLILLIGGLALLTLGIIGEYVARIYVEGKDRPVYIARRVITAHDGNVVETGYERN